jgi:hypothetical protein
MPSSLKKHQNQWLKKQNPNQNKMAETAWELPATW